MKSFDFQDKLINLTELSTQASLVLIEMSIVFHIKFTDLCCTVILKKKTSKSWKSPAVIMMSIHS